MKIYKCPFCGGHADLWQRFSTVRGWFAFVKCDTCGAQTEIFDVGDKKDESWENKGCNDAVNAWNRRIK